MAARYEHLLEKHIEFIRKQSIFFVATATASSSINLSPKGMDAFRVLAPDRVAWLNVTGSGNETSAHVQHDGRMTIMFCAFEGDPLILRLYGRTTVVHHSDPDWGRLAPLFPPLPGSRQIFEMTVEMVQTSCGMAVPLLNFVGDRTQLSDWAKSKGESGIHAYWREKNLTSLDGLPTRIDELNRSVDE